MMEKIRIKEKGFYNILNPATKIILYLWDTRFCINDISSISKNLGMEYKTTYTKINQLEKQGLVKTIKQGKGKSTIVSLKQLEEKEQ